jgi:hypothetical protein
MPIWFSKLLFRRTDAAIHAWDGHDPQWAEFNLPARDDLQTLLSVSSEPRTDIPRYRGI